MSSFIPDLQQSIRARIVSCLGDLSTTPPASSEVDAASAYDVSGNPCITRLFDLDCISRLSTLIFRLWFSSTILLNPSVIDLSSLLTASETRFATSCLMISLIILSILGINFAFTFSANSSVSIEDSSFFTVLRDILRWGLVHTQYWVQVQNRTKQQNSEINSPK